MRRLKALEDENTRLNKIVVDLTLDRECCRTSFPKALKPGRLREIVTEICVDLGDQPHLSGPR